MEYKDKILNTIRSVSGRRKPFGYNPLAYRNNRLHSAIKKLRKEGLVYYKRVSCDWAEVWDIRVKEST